MATNWTYIPAIGDFAATRGNPPNTSNGFLLQNNTSDDIPRNPLAIYQGAPRPSALKTAFALFTLDPTVQPGDSDINISVVGPRVPTANDVANAGNSFSPLVTITPGPGAGAQMPHLNSVTLTAGSPIVQLGLAFDNLVAAPMQFGVVIDFSQSIE